METRDNKSRSMHAPYAIGLVIVSVLVTIAVEESRIATLRTALTTEQKASGVAARVSSLAANNSTSSGEATSASAHPGKVKPNASVNAAASEDESFVKSARKMWDNPAGKSMMNQGVKLAAGIMYQDFIDGLKLTKDEGNYFKTLLGKGFADQQEIGMKMMGASEDEQKALSDEITKRSHDNEDEIKKFLNNDEDFKSFSEYKNRLPEHQQLDGIRTAMSNQGTPLDVASETRLVDAMYKARTESSATNLSGPGAFSEMAKGNLAEAFEKNWEKQQETLRTEAGKILSGTQMVAFQDYQKQVKEMQLMTLKMTEKMMLEKKAGSK